MKHFNIGLVPVVALLTINYSLMSHEVTLKPIEHSFVTCLKNIDFISGTYYTGTGTNNCSGATATIDSIHGLNKFVASATVTTNEITCAGGSIFCCFVESAATSCSPDFGSLPKVSLIFSKPG